MAGAENKDYQAQRALHTDDISVDDLKAKTAELITAEVETLAEYQDDSAKRGSRVKTRCLFSCTVIQPGLACFLFHSSLFTIHFLWAQRDQEAGVENKDYQVQRTLLARVDAGEISVEDLKANTTELIASELEALTE